MTIVDKMRFSRALLYWSELRPDTTWVQIERELHRYVQEFYNQVENLKNTNPTFYNKLKSAAATVMESPIGPVIASSWVVLEDFAKGIISDYVGTRLNVNSDSVNYIISAAVEFTLQLLK